MPGKTVRILKRSRYVDSCVDIERFTFAEYERVDERIKPLILLLLSSINANNRISKAATFILKEVSNTRTLVLAIAIGVPGAFLVNNLWLELIAYHTTVSLLVISQGVLILLLFGMLTVVPQTIRATFVNPVNNLKIE